MGTYLVKEMVGPTLQGEGPHVGMPCLFLRLALCNAWDGRPETRVDSACPYCDTDFRGGEALALESILERLARLRRTGTAPGCVLTGGEPLLQADAELIAALGQAFTWVDIETNGTRPCPPRPGNVYLSCSPKRIARQPLVVEPDWWKILIPDQEGFLDQALASLRPVYVQPTAGTHGIVGQAYTRNLKRCIELCVNRDCRLSVQLHKYIGVP